MIRRLGTLAMVLACVALSACVSASSLGLATLGSSISAQKVDFVEIYGYADRAKLAYADEATIRTHYPKTLGVRSPGNSDIQYFIEQDDKLKIQFITIRGTANKKNLLEDLEIRILADLQIDIPVDSGFDKSTKAIFADVKPYLKKNYKTYVSGHSLGGAVAVLLAVYLIKDGYQVERIVTFGQPKFTTTAGVERIGTIPLIRVVDENDMIPMLPPVTSFRRNDKYEHVGPEVVLLDGTRYSYLSSHDAGRISIGELWRSMRFADLADHHMDNYLNRLSAKRDAAVEVPYDQREKYVSAKAANATGASP
ncbi:lipase family protein [Mesorhizobium sp. ASY16-5R]|uniref:lipase family protein n=1 Tax=Mesorhizobium sp. ASY16-5R TaxID=3445772 RepID=UPI003F9F1D14